MGAGQLRLQNPHHSFPGPSSASEVEVGPKECEVGRSNRWRNALKKRRKGGDRKDAETRDSTFHGPQ